MCKTNYYTPDYLKNFTRRIFEKMGCPNNDAIDIANVFVKAELRKIIETRNQNFTRHTK